MWKQSMWIIIIFTMIYWDLNKQNQAFNNVPYEGSIFTMIFFPLVTCNNLSPISSFECTDYCKSPPSSATFSELQTTSPWPRCRCGCPEIQIWTSEYFAENLHTTIEKQELASVSKIHFIHLHLCSRVENFQVGADIVHPVHLISKWASLLTRLLPD